MAQAVVFEANFPGRLRDAEVDGRDAGRSGVDGFTWTDGGIEGTAHQLFDNIAHAHLSGWGARGILSETLTWIDSLSTRQRIEAGLAWVARWHWLWHASPLEPVATDADETDEIDEPLELAYLLDDDAALLIREALWATASEPLPMALLESLVLWSASGLFDHAAIWPRETVVDQVRTTVRRNTEGDHRLLQCLQLLLAAEQALPVAHRPEPRNQTTAIVGLMALLSLTGETAPPATPGDDASLREWLTIIANPRTWAAESRAGEAIACLEAEGLLEEPRIRAVLAGARASLLARATPKSPANPEVLEVLLQAIHRAS